VFVMTRRAVHYPLTGAASQVGHIHRLALRSGVDRVVGPRFTDPHVVVGDGFCLVQSGPYDRRDIYLLNPADGTSRRVTRDGAVGWIAAGGDRYAFTKPTLNTDPTQLRAGTTTSTPTRLAGANQGNPQIGNQLLAFYDKPSSGSVLVYDFARHRILTIYDNTLDGVYVPARLDVDGRRVVWGEYKNPATPEAGGVIRVAKVAAPA
jgi:hypothetical protein